MKLWQKDYQVDQAIERFTVGRDPEFDLRLAPYDIMGSLAHIRMLRAIGLLSESELSSLTEALRVLYRMARGGDFVIEPGVEDVHSQVELLLTRQLGEAGKKIHAGRSRNDQVLVDLRLFFRAEIQSIVERVSGLFDILLQLAEQHRHALLPGYTHLQAAMPSSFGLWFSAWAECLADDICVLESIYRVVNQNPLGSAAGYGSSFPLDRRLTTQLLGFDDLAYNVVHAQLGRGKTELYLSFALSALGATLGRFAMDIVLYLNQNFAFIRFPDELTTGSSIMPHKKNPDVFELIRARCNQLQALPAQASLLCANLPSGYHRDYQLLKEAVFPAIDSLKDSLDMLRHALPFIEVKNDILADEKYRYLFSVEAVNEAVVGGMSFRDAYRKVGEDIAAGVFQPNTSPRHTHEGSIGNLCLPEIRAKLDNALRRFPFDKVAEKIAALVE
jgi:argininosuccinate lyase